MSLGNAFGVTMKFALPGIMISLAATAALAMFAPVLAHASSASPLARISGLRSTRKRTCPSVTATCNSASSPGEPCPRSIGR